MFKFHASTTLTLTVIIWRIQRGVNDVHTLTVPTKWKDISHPTSHPQKKTKQKQEQKQQKKIKLNKKQKKTINK